MKSTSLRTILHLTICAILIGAVSVSCGESASKKAEKEAALKAAEQAKADSLAKAEYEKKMKEVDGIISMLADEPVFKIETNLGTIKVKLYGDTPLHRKNFAKLALTGFYDGLLFHRVINGFMIQGGDPNTKDPDKAETYGKGGPGYTIPAEILPNHRHKKGALAAARRGDAANPKRESSGSQFYLVQDERGCSSLDGDYTVFGETVQGLEVIDKIASVETNDRNLPIEPVKIISVTLDEASKPAPPTAN